MSSCTPIEFFESFCLSTLPTSVSLPLCLVLSLLSFQGLSIICDEWLVPALEVVCVSLSIPEDVAGVTFMAFGSAAPEIVINSVSTIKTVMNAARHGGVMGADEAEAREQNMGVGAILGSGIIAFTVIPGICALVAPEGLVLKRRPLVRDVVAYGTCLAMLIYHVNGKGSLGVVETGPFLMVYAVFLLVVIFSPTINKHCCLGKRKRGTVDKKKSFVLVRLETMALQKKLATERMRLIEDSKKEKILGYDEEEAERDIIDDIYHYGSIDVDDDEVSQEEVEETTFLGGVRKEGKESWWEVVLRDAWEGFDDEELDVEDFFDQDAGIPGGSEEAVGFCAGIGKGLGFILKTVGFLLRLPMMVIPRSSVNNGNGLCRGVVTFGMSFVVVSYFSFILTTVISHLTALTPLSAPFYGTVIVSIGAEIPDLIQCSTVARRGYGSMAVSNVLGSQVINICLGLGAPWFFSSMYGKDIKFENKGEMRDLDASASVLATVVLIFSACSIGQALINGEKPRLGRGIGIILTVSYVGAMGGYMLWYFCYSL